MSRHATEPGAPPQPGPGTPIVQAGELRSARIESLRAVAALAVMTAHVFVTAHGILGLDFPRRLVVVGGGFGVYLFFALSGYLLFWPFARRDFGGGDRIDLRRYAFNRALRILPLYYFVLVVLLVVEEGGGSAKQWLAFSTFSENFSLDTFNTVDGPMWSLVIELHFYLLLPLIALAVARVARGSVRRAAIALCALAAASLAVRLATVTFAEAPNVYVRFSILSTFFFFVSGMLVALARAAWGDIRPPALRGVAARSEAWIAAAAILWLFACWRPRSDPLIALTGALVVGACVLPLRGGAFMRLLEWRALAAVGVASYSLYLWHLPLIRWIEDLVPGSESFWGLFLLAAPPCVAAAFVSYRLVEAPFLRLRRRWAGSAAAKTEEREPPLPAAVGSVPVGSGGGPAAR